VNANHHVELRKKRSAPTYTLIANNTLSLISTRIFKHKCRKTPANWRVSNLVGHEELHALSFLSLADFYKCPLVKNQKNHPPYYQCAQHVAPLLHNILTAYYRLLPLLTASYRY
jgi:hypothetical protein